jgi:predicted acylesterase/phospholipase RssA
MSSLLADELNRFVCAQRMETGTITRLRSYPVIGQVSSQATIWEAALATSAATGFFKPAKIGDCMYGDGGLGANNPVQSVENEARRLWSGTNGLFESQVKCFLSLGTGDRGINPITDRAWNFFTKSLTRVATDTRAPGEEVAARWRDLPGKPYVRFNVQQGLNTVELADYDKGGHMEAVTSDYLDGEDTSPRVVSCVEILRTKECR